MMSIATGYGRRAWVAKVIFTLVLATGLTGAQAAEPVRLLVLGDSLAAGFGLAEADGFQAVLTAALAARGLAVRLVDAAVSGDTSAGGRARLDWTLAGGPVDGAIVELGANDGLRGTDPRQMNENLAAILDVLEARKIPVLLTGIYPPPNMGAAYTDEFRAVFDRLGKRPGLIYDPFLLAGVAGDPTLNQPDGIHPNPEGVRREVARILPAVEQLVRQAQASEAQASEANQTSETSTKTR